MSRRDRTARAGPAALWFGGGPTALFACVAAGLFSFDALLAASLFGRIWKPVPRWRWRRIAEKIGPDAAIDAPLTRPLTPH